MPDDEYTQPNLIIPPDTDPDEEREPFRRDSAGHYTGHIETRVLVDPSWVELTDSTPALITLGQLVSYARSVTTPTKIALLYPAYLKPEDARRWFGSCVWKEEHREVGPPGDRKPQPLIEQTLAQPRLHFGSSRRNISQASRQRRV